MQILSDNNVIVGTTIVGEATGLIGNPMVGVLQSDLPEMIAILPEKRGTGKARLFNPLQFAMVALIADLLAAEWKLPQASKIAKRVMEAHLLNPTVEQWGIVFTANGNVSTLPFTEAGLSTGYVSGSRLKFALIVDLKNYADRVTAAIADAPRVIGGDDGE